MAKSQQRILPRPGNGKAPDPKGLAPDLHANKTPGMHQREAELIAEVYKKSAPDNGVHAVRMDGGRWLVVDKDQDVICEFAWQYLENRLIGVQNRVQSMDAKLDLIMARIGLAPPDSPEAAVHAMQAARLQAAGIELAPGATVPKP